MASPTLIRPRRPAPVFICRKCLKRSDAAKDIKKAIKRETRHAVDPNGKRARVIMASCFGLCPKRTVVVTAGAGAARGDYALIASADDVAPALALLQAARNKSP
ncbi:hypothetical protein BRADO6623 [Bradyrhizobium sp. ORS 278]|uniref:hypothetical protein n=1 Tax=Bradyrhizobium sp. (strain ORS 278) TaxID=114615 RepID=UPI0001508EF3|nr:hypothetical protein [Bradyrhizobium sp. ORS 278]CAL80227.1 hypothetical protein BRADO6623 [Bradyrhizobium sp. ORS 278]